MRFTPITDLLAVGAGKQLAERAEIVISLQTGLLARTIPDQKGQSLEKILPFTDAVQLGQPLGIGQMNLLQLLRLMIMNDVSTAIAETFLSVVIGNKDESAIDELFVTIDKMGIEEAMDIYGEVYAAYLQKEVLK